MTTDNLINLFAAILVGGGTLTLAVMTWKSIRQTRRQRISDNIRVWARDAIRMLVFADTTQSPPENLEREVNRLKIGIKSIFSETNSIMNDADKFGKVCSQKVLKTIHALTEYVAILEHARDAKYGDKIETLLRELLEDLTDIIDTVSK